MHTKESPSAVLLGEIDIPSGVLLIIDPGLARFWRHDGDPRSPRQSDPEMHDLSIIGPDALTLGREYDRQSDPRFLFDVVNVDELISHFGKFARTRKKQAQLQVLPKRVSHWERAQHAVEFGEGAGVVQYNNLWAVAVANVPRNRPLPVYATPMPDGSEFTGRWHSIDVVIDSKAKAKRSLTTSGVMVEHGQLLYADLQAFGQFRMWESLDGLYDFVFWGADAAIVAEKYDAPKLNDEQYGWMNLQEDEIGYRAQAVQNHIRSYRLHVAVDYRPHCNLEKLNAQIRNSELEVGHLVLNEARVCGFVNRWGDGIFDVIRDLDEEDRLIRIRIELGSEERQSLLRRVRMLHQGAIVSRKILDDGKPIRFAERCESTCPEDSGWRFSAGGESQKYMDDTNNFVVVALGMLIEFDSELEKVLDAPIGSEYRRTKKGYILDQ